MDDNLLGRNIQHMRKIHSETLEALGNTVGYAKSTIKGYENGTRKPDPNTLHALAAHYGKTVDELFHTDLSGLEKISFFADSTSKMTVLYEAMMPLFSSEEAMKNEHFERGFTFSKRILSAFSNGEILCGTMITDVFQEYMTAAEQIEEPEVVANLLWSIFLWWTQIFDMKNMMALQNKLLAKKLSVMELMSSKQNEPVQVKEKKDGFISDFDEIINETIKAMKSDSKWSDLADYYLSLRYIVGLIDTDYSLEMNSAIGIQMMLTFARLGNKYALRFLKICISA